MPDNSEVVSPEPGVAVLQLRSIQKENAGVYACLAHLGAYRDAVALELDVYGEGYIRFPTTAHLITCVYTCTCRVPWEQLRDSLTV